MIFDLISLHMLFYYSSSSFTLSLIIEYVQGEWLRIRFFCCSNNITEFILCGEYLAQRKKRILVFLLILHKRKEHKNGNPLNFDNNDSRNVLRTDRQKIYERALSIHSEKLNNCNLIFMTENFECMAKELFTCGIKIHKG